MKHLTAGLVLAFCLSSAAYAQTSYIPIETTGTVNGNTLTINAPLTQDATDLMIAGGASLNGTATNNTVNISTDITETDTTEPKGQRNHYIAGGAVYANTADGNTVNINGATISGRAVAGGLSRVQSPETADFDKWNTGNATNNTVNITNATIDYNPQTSTSIFAMGSSPVAVAGGASQYFVSNAAGNTVNVTGSQITGSVVGGLSYVQTTQEEVDAHPDLTADRTNSHNSVYLTDSTVTGNVFGSYGGVSGDYNTVVLNHATVTGGVIGAQSGFTLYNADAAMGTFNYNRLDLLNGSSVLSAAVVDANNNNASHNTMNIQNSTVGNGTLYTVRMLHSLEDNSNTVSGTTDYNTLTLTDTPLTAYEIGGAINFTGNPSYNTVQITNSDVTLNYNASTAFGGVMDPASLTAKGLLGTETNTGITLPALEGNAGYILGGLTADYTSQVNDAPSEEAPEEVIKGFGTSANNNTVLLQNGTFNANVIGGLAAYVREVDYTTQTTDDQGRVTQTESVHKNGLTTTTETTSYTYDDAGTPTPTTSSSTTTADLVDTQLSASNNTVILQDVTLNGNVFGGYVDGAELKPENMLAQNNTVMLAGNTKVNGTMYGGTNPYYADTNHLIFSHIADEGNFISYDMANFRNFNKQVSIVGDFDTRLQFTGEDVHATLTLDSSAMQQHDATEIIRTPGEILDGYGPVECNGDPNCIKYTSDVTLANNRLGAYTFTLTPELQGNVLGWTLANHKDQANVEMYGQLPLVGLALVSDGPEMLNQTMNDIWQSDTDQNTFLNGGYHHTRYETGSGFDLDSSLVQAGAWKKFTDDWVLGFFAKYANGSYDTFPIKVSGTANAFAGGLMTSLRYSETGRLEVSAEVGYLDMDFDSDELLSSFTSNGLYYGATAGFVENLMQDLDLFANIQWLHKEKDDITDNLNQKIQFDAMESLALRFGADYTFNSLNLGGLTPALGVSGIYEMDGDSTVIVEGMKNDEASLKGLSGRGEFSLVYHNQDLFLPLHTVLTVFGQVGKREGVGGEVNISFEF